MILTWTLTDNTFKLWEYGSLNINYKQEYLKVLTNKTFNDDIAFLITATKFVVRYNDDADQLLVSETIENINKDKALRQKNGRTSASCICH